MADYYEQVKLDTEEANQEVSKIMALVQKWAA